MRNIRITRNIRRLTGALVCLVGVLTLPGVLATAATAAPEVTRVRIGVHPDSTRVVLELSETVDYQLFTLSNPYRVVIDLPEVRWRVAEARMRASKGLVNSLRFGLFQAGNSRVVLGTNVPTIITKHFVLPADAENPVRFVLDLKQTTTANFAPGRKLKSSGWKPVARRRPSTSGENGRAGRHVIVLDPGHGGVDPGTIGVTGAYEKKITLAIARQAKKIFEATGRYKVILTRKRDVYVRLRDRFEIAHRNKAEVFISLHADSIKNRNIRGGSIYTLSDKASDREAATLAAKENKSDIIAGADLSGYAPEVSEILIDLAQTSTNKESWHLAEFMVKALGKRTRLLRNTHRFAGFAVLKSPNVPSVLLELGYLSNRADEKMLRNAKYRTRISRALLQAVDKYFARKRALQKS